MKDESEMKISRFTTIVTIYVRNLPRPNLKKNYTVPEQPDKNRNRPS